VGVKRVLHRREAAAGDGGGLGCRQRVSCTAKTNDPRTLGDAPNGAEKR
jgi:hypothetical protein